MKDGNIVEFGTNNEIFNSPKNKYTKELVSYQSNIKESKNFDSDTILKVEDLDVWYPIKKGLLKKTVDYVKAIKNDVLWLGFNWDKVTYSSDNFQQLYEWAVFLIDQGLATSRVFAGHMARFFIGLEFALGFLILLPFYLKQLMQFTFLLLGGFTAHLIYLWSIGDNENCGCFGEMISMTPEQSML